MNTLLVQVDTARFLKLLSSVLMPLKRNKEQYTIEYTLFYNSVDELKIVVTNSPLLMDADNEREREIQHAACIWKPFRVVISYVRKMVNS